MALRHRIIGKAARVYWRLFRPRTLTVRAIVWNGSGQVLLVRHTYGNLWHLPGGSAKKGESFEVALRRELEEEIDLCELTVERVVGIYHSTGEYKDDHIVIFAVRTRQAVRIADPNEVREIGWFSPDALPPDISPATNRRLGDYRRGEFALEPW
ncbi:NUDIX domain-containing protein [Novosphingobium sp. KN65.2]|uniref:NUDIX domain-containing protein n=1 Tax=Novosphingobium sp. KN65.2 TaxID=1478134 RepID=UPI0005E8D3A0|nr:NUDIX domain-containing protein [Novosphingobium sp. KN65.2]CDO37447.1 NUDIX hydrolase [Novosphingobium sp. KN65.2]